MHCEACGTENVAGAKFCFECGAPALVELPLGGELISAPRRRSWVQFRWVGIEGRADERVDGSEQPVFAWR